MEITLFDFIMAIGGWAELGERVAKQLGRTEPVHRNTCAQALEANEKAPKGLRKFIYIEAQKMKDEATAAVAA